MNNFFKALSLAKCLFELEGESVFNDPDSHWTYHNWYDKYGSDSIKHKDFEYPKEDILIVTNAILNDYQIGYLDSLEYNPYVSDNYTGYITKSFDKQLASKTKVGYQLELA